MPNIPTRGPVKGLLGLVVLWAMATRAEAVSTPVEGVELRAGVRASLDGAQNSPNKQSSTDITPADAIPPTLSEADRDLLSQWFQHLGSPQQGERFGELVARAARFHLGRAYHDPQPKVLEEYLRVRLSTLQCVSLIESSMSVARCLWQEDPSEACFLDEVQKSRYRSGEIDGYSSRLHYFADWIVDNAARGRVESLSARVGAEPKPFEWRFMTRHPERYPQLSSAEVFQQIQAHEQRLSAEPQARLVVPRDKLVHANTTMQDGDIVAIVGDKPGLLIRHVGLVVLDGRGQPRLLHASSYHGRVLLTPYSVARYVKNRPDRRGIKLLRPQPPTH